MITRRFLLQSAATVAAYSAQGFRAARAENAPGVTDTEIKIGQTLPYSGPASAYGVIGRTQLAYFKMLNEQGGVNGRKINFISLDDGYSPPKTVEQTRRLVEQERVALLFGALGTATNLAIRQYCNDNKVPQLFVLSGAPVFADPQRFPWTIPALPSYLTEGRIYAKHILATKPDARIGALHENDDFGKDYLAGLKNGLGSDRAGMIVKEASFDVSEPTVDFGGHHPARLGRRRIRDRGHSQGRGPGDPQILRPRLECGALSQLHRSLHRRDPQASRPRQIEGAH